MNWSYCFLDSIPDTEYNIIYNSLSPTRREYIDSLKKEHTRRQSLAGEFLVKKLLRESFKLKNPVISRNEIGQPYVEGSDVYISISHSGNLVAAAADRKPIGIDAEQIKPRNLRLIERVCTPEEKEYILSGDKLKRFYEIWTGKEAYFKKQGTGITDLKSVNIPELNRFIFTLDNYIIQIV